MFLPSFLLSQPLCRSHATSPSPGPLWMCGEAGSAHPLVLETTRPFFWAPGSCSEREGSQGDVFTCATVPSTLVCRVAQRGGGLAGVFEGRLRGQGGMWTREGCRHGGDADQGQMQTTLLLRLRPLYRAG